MLENGISEDIMAEAFTSNFDGSRQTFLLQDFRATPSSVCPLLVVYLHGANSHQEQGMTAGIYENAFGRMAGILESRGAVYACPEYRGNSWMGPSAECDVRQIIKMLRLRYQPEQVLLVGGSMGGTSALIYAVRHPEDLDGVLAFCPASDPVEIFNQDDRFQADLIRSFGGAPSEVSEVYRERTSWRFTDRVVELPMVIIHGTADISIPFHHSVRFTEALSRVGGEFIFHTIEDGGHDSPLDLPLDDFFRYLLDK